MRTSALVRVAAALTASLLAAPLLGSSPSHADEPALPVVVADTIALYPGQVGQVNVLTNDSSPDGDDLALCRFPEPSLVGNTMPAVVATDVSSLAEPGEVMVMTAPRARGTHVIDYYVCDHTHLVPAQLTVEIKAVAPVKVHKVAGKPGRLAVTNKNDKAIRFWYGDRRADKPDGKVSIPAGATRMVAVRRHTIVWIALIGGNHGKAALLSSPGIAGHGVVRGIKLRPGTELPRPPKSKPEPDFRSSAGARWLPRVRLP
ncbi:Ig-like domain-containing protein [Nocardioides conyzicola]|uniref:Uncharacterized protein n=1 Tax=Nocardioides conyzicola TaxID=1651781 RepID=A0ABP8Y0Q5_9ACTN